MRQRSVLGRLCYACKLFYDDLQVHNMDYGSILCCPHKSALPTRTGASARIHGPVIVLERSLILLCQIVNGWRQAEGNDSSSWHNKEIFTRTVFDSMNASSSVIVCSRCPEQEPVQVLSLVVRLLFCSETQPRRTRTYVPPPRLVTRYPALSPAALRLSPRRPPRPVLVQSIALTVLPHSESVLRSWMQVTQVPTALLIAPSVSFSASALNCRLIFISSTPPPGRNSSDSHTPLISLLMEVSGDSGRSL